MCLVKSGYGLKHGGIWHGEGYVPYGHFAQHSPFGVMGLEHGGKGHGGG